MKNKRKLLIIVISVLLLGLLFIVGVMLLGRSLFSVTSYDSSNDIVSYEPDRSYDSSEYLMSTITSSSPASEKFKSNTGSTNEFSNTSLDKNIVKIGLLNIYVDDIDKSEASVRAAINKFNAEIVQSYDNGKGISRKVGLEIKVEVSKFEELYLELKNLDGEVRSSSIDTEDITNQVVDLEARLKTYRNTETQLMEVLKSASNVTDTMAVHKELREIRTNIEILESQLKEYANKSDYSTIKIVLMQSSSGSALEDSKWDPYGVFKDAIRAFVAFVKGIGTVAIWAFVFGIPILLLYVLARKVIKRRQK